MHKVIKVIGVIIVSLGFFIMLVEMSYFLNSEKTQGTIVRIEERGEGLKYKEVESGGNNACILTLEFKTKDNKTIKAPTSHEIPSCKRFLGSNYNMGDSVSMLYSKFDQAEVRVNQLVQKGVYMAGFVGVGSAILLYMKRFKDEDADGYF